MSPESGCLHRFFGIVRSGDRPRPYLTGYFAKVLAVVCTHRPGPLIRYLDKTPGVAAAFCDHLDSSSLASAFTQLVVLPFDTSRAMTRLKLCIKDDKDVVALLLQRMCGSRGGRADPFVAEGAMRVLAEILPRCRAERQLAVGDDDVRSMPAAEHGSSRATESVCTRILNALRSGEHADALVSASFAEVAIAASTVGRGPAVPQNDYALRVLNEVLKDARAPAIISAMVHGLRAEEAPRAKPDATPVRLVRYVLPHVPEALSFLQSHVKAGQSGTTTRLGGVGLMTTRLLATLLVCDGVSEDTATRISQCLVDLLFAFPWNDLVHREVSRGLQSVFSFWPAGSALWLAIVKDCGLVDRLVQLYPEYAPASGGAGESTTKTRDAWDSRAVDDQLATAPGLRESTGIVGFMQAVANAVVAAGQQPGPVADYLAEHSGWERFVDGALLKANLRSSTILGGRLPADLEHHHDTPQVVDEIPDI